MVFVHTFTHKYMFIVSWMCWNQEICECKDLSSFLKIQVMMVRWLSQNISRTSGLPCSCQDILKRSKWEDPWLPFWIRLISCLTDVFMEWWWCCGLHTWCVVWDVSTANWWSLLEKAEWKRQLYLRSHCQGLLWILACFPWRALWLRHAGNFVMSGRSNGHAYSILY